MASYRYWRVKATTMHGSSGGFCACQELRMLTDWDGPNASGGTPISDSAYPGLPASAAFDGTNAQWASNGTGTASYIGYDFGSAVELKEVWYTPRGDSSYQQIFTVADIDGSSDGSSWTTVVSGWTPATWVQGHTQGVVVQGSKPADGTAGAGSHRYWRLLTRTLDAGSGNAIVAAQKVEWRLTASGAQAATGGTPMAGSYFGSPAPTFSPAAAYDTDSTTLWASAGLGWDWIGYDFGTAKQIAEMAYTSRDDASYVQTWATAVVQSSDDGVAWTTAVGLLTAAAWSQNQTQVFTVQAAGGGGSSARPVVFICT
jgi:hypothetical protein